MNPQKEHKAISRLDMLGFSASTICAIHCALIPVVLLFLPLIGLEFLHNPAIELTLIGLSLLIGIYTLRSGYRKHHGRIYPTVLFILGLAIITIGHFAGGHNINDGHGIFDGHSHSLETNGIIALMVIPIGAVLIAIAHYMNRKMCLSCKVDHKHNEPGPHEHPSELGHSHDHTHIHHHHEKNQKQEPADAI